MTNQSPLFTFAAVTDSHLNPEGVENTSPWRTNRLANARNEFVVDELNRLKPAFVIHIGDIVHPLPSSRLFEPAADYAKRLFGRLTCPFHLLPGNHDVGDKPLDWMPADRITSAFIDKYRETFGPDKAAFGYQGCRFILINSSLLNSGLPQEAEQRQWLEGELAAAAGQRIFFFTHYPPFIARANEDSHYDNLDEPARGWLLDLLLRHNVEALFAGHVHNFFYNRNGPTHCYVLSSVTSLRQDYAELFRIEPAEEYGRNDTAKLGFFLIDVYPDRHVARFVRTDGLTPENVPAGRSSLTPKTVASPVGVHLRHQWADETELPYNGPLDELSRKRARNDYGLLAMWDLGIKQVRVPVSDLKADDIRARMSHLHDLGVRFTVFSFGVPDRATLSLMEGNHNLVERWELVLPKRSLANVIDLLKPLRERLPPIFLSRLQEHDGAKHDPTKPFDHSISIGFAAQSNDVLEWLAQPNMRSVFSGISFTIEPGQPIAAATAAIAEIAHREAIGTTASVKLGPSGSATKSPPINAVSARVAETLLCALCQPGVSFFLDTFQEIDRGYFLRPGLIDRRCNPSAAGKVFRDLFVGLRAAQPRAVLREVEQGGRRGIIVQTGIGQCVLWLSDHSEPVFETHATDGALAG